MFKLLLLHQLCFKLVVNKESYGNIFTCEMWGECLKCFEPSWCLHAFMILNILSFNMLLLLLLFALLSWVTERVTLYLHILIRLMKFVKLYQTTSCLSKVCQSLWKFIKLCQTLSDFIKLCQNSWSSSNFVKLCHDKHPFPACCCCWDSRSIPKIICP